MQSRLTKSLFLGLAVLSLGAVSATTAQAAKKTKVTSTTNLSYKGSKRNVQSNGKNALYTKPGVVKGAKKVLSKTSMKKFGTSKKSKQYFRAYQMAKTNKGTYYYKVVSMDGKYRGFVYGGTKKGTFAGGIKKAATTKNATMPSTTTMYFAKPGTQNVTWSAPRYTQYGASTKVSDTTAYANDELTVTKAVKKSREGTLYYYVKDAKNPEVNGYIYYKALTATKPATDASAKDGVTFNYINKSTGTKVDSKIYAYAKDVTTLAKADAYTQAENLKPAGYTLAGKDADTTFGNVADTYAKDTTVTVYVTANNSVTLSTTLKVYNGDADADAQTSLKFPTAVNTAIQADAFFKQPSGLAATASDIETHLKADGAGDFTVVTEKTDPKDSTKHIAYKFTLNHATDAVFGGTASTIYYNAQRGFVTSTTSVGDFTPAN